VYPLNCDATWIENRLVSPNDSRECLVHARLLPVPPVLLQVQAEYIMSIHREESDSQLLPVPQVLLQLQAEDVLSIHREESDSQLLPVPQVLLQLQAEDVLSIRLDTNVAGCRIRSSLKRSCHSESAHDVQAVVDINNSDVYDHKRARSQQHELNEISSSISSLSGGEEWSCESVYSSVEGGRMADGHVAVGMRKLGLHDTTRVGHSSSVPHSDDSSHSEASHLGEPAVADDSGYTSQDSDDSSTVSDCALEYSPFGHVYLPCRVGSDSYFVIARSPSSDAVHTVALVDQHWPRRENADEGDRLVTYSNDEVTERLSEGFQNPDHGSYVLRTLGHLFCDMVAIPQMEGISITTHLRGVPLCLTYQRDEGSGHMGNFDNKAVFEMLHTLIRFIESGDDYEFRPGRIGFIASFSACGLRVFCKVGNTHGLTAAIGVIGYTTTLSMSDPSSHATATSADNYGRSTQGWKIIHKSPVPEAVCTMAQVEPDGPRLDYGFDAPVGLSLLCHSMGKSCTAVGISTTTYVRGVPLFLTYKHEVGNGHKGKFRVEEEAMVRFNNLFCLVGKHDDFEPGCTVTTSACGVRVHCKVGHSINMEKSAIV